MGLIRQYPETAQEVIRGLDVVIERMSVDGARDFDFEVVCLVTALLRELQAIAPSAFGHALIRAVSVMRAAEIFSQKMKKGGAK